MNDRGAGEGGKLSDFKRDALLRNTISAVDLYKQYEHILVRTAQNFLYAGNVL
jgi:hypothetical protein